MNTGKNNLIGKTVMERYKVLRVIEKNMYVISYLAIDEKGNRTYALNTFCKRDFSESQLCGMREQIKEMQGLNHPVFTRIFEVCEDDNNIYVIVDYSMFEGKNLYQYIEMYGTISPSNTVRWMIQICDAMKMMDGAHLTKRVPALYPTEIIIQPTWKLQIRTLDLIPHEFDALGGSLPLFTAPEVFLNLKLVDERSIVYSVGAIMHFCMTGTIPIKTGDKIEYYSPVRLKIMPEKEQIECACPPYLAWLVENCMEKNPAKRPSSLDELIYLLNCWLYRFEEYPAAKRKVIKGRIIYKLKNLIKK